MVRTRSQAMATGGENSGESSGNFVDAAMNVAPDNPAEPSLAQIQAFMQQIMRQNQENHQQTNNSIVAITERLAALENGSRPNQPIISNSSNSSNHSRVSNQLSQNSNANSSIQNVQDQENRNEN